MIDDLSHHKTKADDQLRYPDDLLEYAEAVIKGSDKRQDEDDIENCRDQL